MSYAPGAAARAQEHDDQADSSSRGAPCNSLCGVWPPPPCTADSAVATLAGATLGGRTHKLTSAAPQFPAAPLCHNSAKPDPLRLAQLMAPPHCWPGQRWAAGRASTVRMHVGLTANMHAHDAQYHLVACDLLSNISSLLTSICTGAAIKAVPWHAA